MDEHFKSRPIDAMSRDRDDVFDPDEGLVRQSGLLDGEWYCTRYAQTADAIDPVTHFCRVGWQRGLRPNPYFDPNWYTETYGSELAADENPLLHYIRRGERESAWPSPHFDPEWYRDQHALRDCESPLRHYLLNRLTERLSPLPTFDAAEYVSAHPECLAASQDPYLHWLEQPGDALQPAPPGEAPLAAVLRLIGGQPETREFPDVLSGDSFKQVLRLFVPLLPFDEAWYCKAYPDVAQAVKCHLISSAHQHFIDYGFFEGRSPGAKVGL